MPVCFPDSGLCITLSVTSTIPLIHIVFGYLQHNYQDYYLQEKEKFKGSRRNFVLNYLSLGIKICMLSSFIIFSFTQAIFNLVYHTNYWMITFLELVIILTYCLQIVMFIYDALQYGQTTTITIINLTIQMVTYYLFICVIFFSEGNVINRNDVCWILFLMRGILQLFFLISTIFNQQDKQLIQTIVTEYEYQQSLITQEEKQQNQQESQNKNISIFTFNGDISNNTIDTIITITDIEVKKYKESDKYDKKTIIYEINFIQLAQKKRVYRSFREFLSFYHDLKTHYFGFELPLFPSKKPTSKTLSPEDIEERRCLLDQFMKGIISNKQIEGGDLLKRFLNLNCDTPQYIAKYPIPQKTSSKVKRTNISVPKSKKTYESIPETIWEGQLEEDEDEEEDDRSRTSRRIRSYQVHQDQDKDRTLDKYQSMDDRMNINEKETYKFQFEEEEKHSSEKMNIS